MLALTTNSPLAIFLIVIAMAIGATVGIAIIALLASEFLRAVFWLGGDRDAEMMDTDEAS